MTKKHFDALAAALRGTRPYADRADIGRAGAQWEQDVVIVADVCARFNPNFDRARFLSACGVES